MASLKPLAKPRDTEFRTRGPTHRLFLAAQSRRAGLDRQRWTFPVAAKRRLLGFGQVIADVLLPAQCLNCGRPVSGAAGVCATCFAAITWLDDNACDRCGVLLDSPAPDVPLMAPGAHHYHRLQCIDCHERPPPFGHSRAVMVYDHSSRDIVLRLKHADRIEAVPTLARWMARAGADLLKAEPLLIPVPLHWRRLFQRRDNQAALLAQAVSRQCGLRCLADGLQRTRHTLSQGNFDLQGPQGGRQARQRNIQDAFRITDSRRIMGRSVVLVDDVMTTGATVGECARLLLEHGAQSVDVLVVARAILESPIRQI
jgi:ComF family protein